MKQMPTIQKVMTTVPHSISVDDNIQKAATLMARETWDTGLLTELAQTMQDASICGLGQAAPNPLLSVLKFFPHELEEKP